MAVGCNQLCRRVCALQCGGGLVRSQPRRRWRRAAQARSRGAHRGVPADVKPKLVLGLSCVAEGLHVAFLSEFDYAGEELRSWVRLVPIAVMGMFESALRPSPGQSDKTSFIRIDGGCVVDGGCMTNEIRNVSS